MSKYTMTSNSITINGQTATVVAWSMDEESSIISALVSISGKIVKINFKPDHEAYNDALAAYTGESQETEETAQETEETAQQPEEAQQPAAVNPDKAAHGPVPEKTWIGEKIIGNGWVIDFDKTFEKTRVIFEKFPTKEARELVKAAGFWWNKSTGSWNKGLNWRAYRAAQALAGQLANIRVY